MATDIKIYDFDEIQKALKGLEPKIARKIVRQAQRKSAKLFAEEIRQHVPVDTGNLRDSIKVRASKGPRGSNRKTISIAVLVGQAGRPGDSERGFRAAFYNFMQEHGWTVGKRIRIGKIVMGHGRAHGNLGAKGVHEVEGKHYARNALKSKEPEAMALMVSEILMGIDREVAKQSGSKPVS